MTVTTSNRTRPGPLVHAGPTGMNQAGPRIWTKYPQALTCTDHTTGTTNRAAVPRMSVGPKQGLDQEKPAPDLHKHPPKIHLVQPVPPKGGWPYLDQPPPGGQPQAPDQTSTTRAATPRQRPQRGGSS